MPWKNNKILMKQGGIIIIQLCHNFKPTDAGSRVLVNI